MQGIIPGMHHAPLCIRCGCFGHIASNCIEETNVIGKPVKNNFCTQCGLYGHVWKECKKSRMPKTWCERCSKFGHEADKCNAVYTAFNRLIVEDVCFKCGYFGHDPEDCTRNVDVSRCCRCARYGHNETQCNHTTTVYGTDLLKNLQFCGKCGYHGHAEIDCKGSLKYNQWKPSSGGNNDKRSESGSSSSSSGSSSGSDSDSENEDGEMNSKRKKARTSVNCTCCLLGVDNKKTSVFTDDSFDSIWKEDFEWLKN